MHDNLVQLAQHFQILDNVRILVRDEDEEELIDRHEDVPDHICLYMRCLSTLLNELGEVCHVLLHLEAINRDELTRDEDLARLATDAGTDYYHDLFLFF